MSEQAKKGLHPLAWVAIGCGALLVVGLVVGGIASVFVFNKAKDVVQDVAADFEANPAKTAAQMVVRIDPDLELVESDDEAGTMTVRNQRTGEVVTLDFDEIAEGRFSWEGSDGRMEIDASQAQEGAVTVSSEDGTARFGTGSEADVPDWVPIYPGTTPAGAYSNVTADTAQGLFTFQTDAEAEEVLQFYRSRFEAEGYEVERVTHETSAGVQGTIQATDEAKGRTLAVTAAPQGEGTQGTVNYSGKG